MSLLRTVKFVCVKNTRPEAILGIKAAPNISALPSTHDSEPALKQLSRIFDAAVELGCQCVAVESHYVDRDFMEDFASFYSRSFQSLTSYCRRVHFFRAKCKYVKDQFARVLGPDRPRDLKTYLGDCERIAKSIYLGFCVIRPLSGTPVGRTVIRPPSTFEEHESAVRNVFCVRDYTVHFAGVELRINGLAFQQQDTAVSVCATSSIWVSLQMLQSHEVMSSATPAEITNIATKSSLPYGRAMPSDGLSVDQMCQAVQAFGVAPNISLVEEKPNVARGILHAILTSRLVPILMLTHPDGLRHAVAVTGMRTRSVHEFTPFATDEDESDDDKKVLSRIDDLAGDLVGLYCHDDRIGPYVYCEWNMFGLQRASLRIGTEETEWQIDKILTPIYPKVRIAVIDLRKISCFVAQRVCAYLDITDEAQEIPKVGVENWIERGHRYLLRFVAGQDEISKCALKSLVKISLPRYIGVVRLSCNLIGRIDVVIDTTCTVRNLHVLCIVPHKFENDAAVTVANYVSAALSDVFVCL